MGTDFSEEKAASIFRIQIFKEEYLTSLSH
jgi:hypothetical protein